MWIGVLSFLKNTFSAKCSKLPKNPFEMRLNRVEHCCGAVQGLSLSYGVRKRCDAYYFCYLAHLQSASLPLRDRELLLSVISRSSRFRGTLTFLDLNKSILGHSSYRASKCSLLCTSKNKNRITNRDCYFSSLHIKSAILTLHIYFPLLH